MSDSTESSAYFYRIISLVVDVGTETLRDIFYWKVPKSNVVTLFATPGVQSEFKRLKGIKALTEVQYAKVTNKPDPDTYDISLLTTLLTNQKICRISKPKDGWGKVPDQSDISLGADLLRLREIRNEIIAHRNKAQLEVEDYKKIWGNVEIVLLRLAANIDASEKDKVKEKIRSAETRVLEPFHDREKKLLQVFIEWQKEDNKKTEVQLSDISNKLENLHLKVDSLKTPADETDAARSNVTSEDTLSSIQSQVSSVLENLGSIATQDDVSQIQANMKRMEDNVKAISELVKILKETVEKSNHNLEELSKNAHISGCQPMSAIFERDQGRPYVPDRPKKPKIENPHAMTDKEILELSKKIGYEWESLRIHLDFTEAQGHALKWAFNDDVQVRIYQMLKGWHDVVVDCGENPKKLLAAAFVNASTNYQMAYSIVPRQQFDPNAELDLPRVRWHSENINSARLGFEPR
ncbi:E3 ubiquitin-protein ligase DZIP3-like [Ruditapes philippinarum]|uniref:E3 ubiquitin-protein ligase DZIP3-like n=1 Tax=Ruditapes philippinarum TaxID=129788 RepID=UPI00295B3694|nr:E3 ubiquitin-protein ligase DZIP3-like [Ruditapes philippinarum]